jgi:methylamine dehydrogenase heavy chain
MIRAPAMVQVRGTELMRLATLAGYLATIGAAAFLGVPATAADFPNPLPIEETGKSAFLPAQYPASWMFVQDVHFDSLVDGRGVLVDTAADSNAVKGLVQMAQFGALIVAKKSPHVYVAETYYSRLSRGTRTDVVTIYDKATLAPQGEIVLPGGKRAELMPPQYNFQFTNDEKWGLVYNFTPASSVTVVDLEARKVLSSIDIPGCSLIYPTGSNGFSSLCADGTMTTVLLNAHGAIDKTVTSKGFNDLDKDPMFMIPAMVGRTAWFATFHGSVRGIDLSGPVARDLGAFPMPQEKTSEGEWRPGGWQVIAASPTGTLYILMNPAGKEGSHKDGGTEVWMMDTTKKARTGRFELKHTAVSIATTADAVPSLVASCLDGSLDVYNSTTGKLIRTIPAVAHEPYLMAQAR